MNVFFYYLQWSIWAIKFQSKAFILPMKSYQNGSSSTRCDTIEILLNYYSKFLPNLSYTLAPLYRLLQKNTRWCWESEQRKAFQQAKESLTSDCVLAHLNQLNSSFWPVMPLLMELVQFCHTAWRMEKTNP